MKTLTIIPLILTVVALLIVQTVFGNDDKYIAAMQKNIQLVYTADTLPELQDAANAFERIASAEKTKWEPYYYATFAYVMMSNYDKDANKRDQYLDMATVAIGKAKEIEPNESEVIAMEGFIYMMRLTIDPGTRGPRYAGLSMQTFEKALAVNPENPRALALKAQMEYGTAKFFGSSTEPACITTRLAVTKFETYRSPNVLAPQWGKKMAESMLTNCQ